MKNNIAIILLILHLFLLFCFFTFGENEKSKVIKTHIQEPTVLNLLENLSLSDFLQLNDTLQLCLVVNHEGENLLLSERQKIAEVVLNRRDLNYNGNGVELSSQILAPKQFSHFVKNNFLNSMAYFNPQNKKHIETYNLCRDLLKSKKRQIPISVIGFCHKTLYKIGKGKLYCSNKKESHSFYHHK